MTNVVAALKVDKMIHGEDRAPGARFLRKIKLVVDRQRQSSALVAKDLEAIISRYLVFTRRERD